MNTFIYICPDAFHTYAYIFEQHGVCMGAVSKSYTSHDVFLQFYVSDVETFFKRTKCLAMQQCEILGLEFSQLVNS